MKKEKKMYDQVAKMAAQQRSVLGDEGRNVYAGAASSKPLTLVDEVNSRLWEMNGRVQDIVNKMENFYSRIGLPAVCGGTIGSPEPETVGFQTTEKALTALSLKLSDLLTLADNLYKIG